jgi:hypothetical protein
MKPVYEAYKQAFNRLADMVEGIEKITDLKLPQLQGERVRFTATTNQTDKNSEDSTNNKSLPAIGV